MARTLLVTGGSGYFGSILAEMARARGDRVRVFDVNPPEADPGRVEYIAGDVRDRAAVTDACDGVDVVLHNVAQVPLAKDRDLFWSVNVTGTANVLLAARDQGVAKVVHTSSSAIFGVPERNPVTEDTPGRPLEAYGRAKLEAELCCRDAAEAGLDVTIVRPAPSSGTGAWGSWPCCSSSSPRAHPSTCWAGATTATSSSTRTTSPTPACGPPTATSPPCTTSAPPSSAPCARPSRPSSTTPAPGRGSARCRPAPPVPPCGWPPGWAWRRSRPITGCSTPNPSGSTPPRPRPSCVGSRGTPTPRHSSSPTSGSSPTARTWGPPSAPTTSPPSGSAC